MARPAASLRTCAPGAGSLPCPINVHWDSSPIALAATTIAAMKNFQHERRVPRRGETRDAREFHGQEGDSCCRSRPPVLRHPIQLGLHRSYWRGQAGVRPAKYARSRARFRWLRRPSSLAPWPSGTRLLNRSPYRITAARTLRLRRRAPRRLESRSRGFRCL